MGFDATLGFVVNMGAPPSPVAYYQQVGRAGRGTDRASVVLLPQPEDRDIWAYFASLAFPREDQVRHTLRVLTDEGGSLSTAALETYIDLGRTRLEQMLKVLDVDGAVRRVRGGWVATGEPWTYDAERYARVSEARKREQQAMLDYLDTDRCRMWFLRDQLDDPAIGGSDERCGRCDRCGGFDLPTEISGDAVGEARVRLARPGVVVEPRSMWPTALANLGIELKGRISEGAEPGRAVARLTDLGHGQVLRELFGGEPHDAPMPESLVRAVIEVLHDWRPHVEGIVVVESATRPSLSAELADGLSRFLQRPLVARWAIADASVAPGQGAMNSAQRVAAVVRRYRLEGDPPAGPVLLVDDQVVTGWTLTVAARALREAGATEVLPLTLAVRS
jgi:ATP-dependent DNA helicase RecQ